MVAVQSPVRMQRQRDVATPAAAGASARATMDRAGHAPPIEQENRSSATLLDRRELGQKWRRERVSRLAPQIDDAYGREGGSDPCRQLEAIEPRPTLDARRGTPVDGDCALERRTLRSEGARVVPWIRFLLERGVVLLIDDDQPEVVDRGEDCGAGPDDDTGLAARDSLALVTSLRLAERGMENRNTPSEACAEPAYRLRGKGDLRHQHDRASTTLEGSGARLKIDLGLPASRRAVKEEMATACIERDNYTADRIALGRSQLLGLVLAREGVVERGCSTLTTTRTSVRRDESERSSGGRPVVVREPESELDECGWDPVDHRPRIGDRNAVRLLDARGDHDSSDAAPTETDRKDIPATDVLRYLIGERAGKRAGRNERVDLRQRHGASVAGRPRRRRYAAAGVLGFRKKK